MTLAPFDRLRQFNDKLLSEIVTQRHRGDYTQVALTPLMAAEQGDTEDDRGDRQQIISRDGFSISFHGFVVFRNPRQSHI